MNHHPNTSPASTSTRRAFLKKTASATFGLTVLPSYLALGRADSAGNLPPSQRLNLGCVGVGGRGWRVLEGLAKSGHAKPLAFCDVDFQAPGADHSLQAFPGLPQFADFRVMMDRMGDDIDAVSVATPDHTHFVVALEAMRRGKHVYVEKPLTHSFREAELLIQAEKRYGVVTQMGNQGHTSGGAQQFQNMVEGGVIKNIVKIDAFMGPFKHPGTWYYEPDRRISQHPSGEPVPRSLDYELWCGPAEKKPFSSLYHPMKWRAFHLYGNGMLGDWGAHILDFIHDYLELGLPRKIELLEIRDHNQVIFPLYTRLRMDFPRRGKELPPCQLFWTDGPGYEPAIPEQYWEKTEGESVPPKISNRGSLLYRKDGKFIIQRGTHGGPSQLLPRSTMSEYREYIKVPKVTQSHQENFVQACLGKGKTTSPFSVAGPLTQMMLLGALCQYMGEGFRFDPKRKRIRGNKTASELLHGPPPRKGWEEYYA